MNTLRFYSLISNGSTENARAFKREWTPDVDSYFYRERGYSLLYAAAGCRNTEIVQFLLENGADPNERTYIGYTPMLSYAFTKESISKTHYMLLLKYGGNPYLTNNQGDSVFSQPGRWEPSVACLEGYLVVDLICGEADNIPLDVWRVVKPFIYKI